MQSERHNILFWGFGMILGVVIAISAFTYININNMMESSKWVAHTYEVLGKLDELQILLLDGESALRSYAVTGQDLYVEPVRRVKRDVEPLLFKIRDLTIDNESQQKRITFVENNVRNKVGVMDRLIEVRDDQGPDAAVKMIAGEVPHKVMDAVASSIAAMKTEEQKLLQERFTKAENQANQTQSLIPVLIFVEFAGLCGCYFWVTGIVPPPKPGPH